MITIVVASFNGAPLAQPLAAHFDEMGGNIGRAENNQLVLPDPERTISRVHAQIVFRRGRYAVVDRGSNPIAVNGRPLGNGKESMLEPGDEIAIGGYVMRVETGGHGDPAPDPFADFPGLAASNPGVPARPLTAPLAQPSSAGGSVDPLAVFGMAPSPPAPGAGMSAPAGGIPDDWDPFAPDPTSARPHADDFARSLGQPQDARNFGLEVGGRPAPLVPELPGRGPPGSDSLDNLFGLRSEQGGDPLAGSPLQLAAAQPNMAAHADPMKSLNSVGRASAAAAPDLLPELNMPFRMPPMGESQGRPAMVAGPIHSPAPPSRLVPEQSSPPPGAVSTARHPAPPMPSVPPAWPPASPAAGEQGSRAAETPKGAVVSWNEPSGESRTIIRRHPAQPAVVPSARAADVDPPTLGSNPAAAGSSSMPPPAPGFAPTQPAAAATRPAAAIAARSIGAADAQVLIAALREGLAVDTVPPEALALTPELMRLLGRLVHEATLGTVDLLVARAALKREIRAEVTMIVSRENNPLKFSPSVEVALHHLLMPPARGFMAPERAMRDAYDDLRAHQFGFLAGMRAALEGVLRRFDPAVLEDRLSQVSGLSTLLAGGRKARMWELFRELYTQISTEAADDFHELFGKEFLRAYEEYVDQLTKDRK